MHSKETNPSSQPGTNYTLILSLTALGVVYGDIGTSPLYALRECFFGPHAIPANPTNILGVLSLIFWALILVISIKYLVFILKADNQGEGGILALTALVAPESTEVRGWRRILIFLGLFGAALLYGDGMITPAISVLSAVEGLEIVTPVFAPYVIPLTVVILIALFLCQHRGTSGIGAIFGPITLFWFVVLALLGIRHIVQQPVVLGAISPYHALEFFLNNGWTGFLVLGSVFLVVTGGEALYADMGHFGPKPIRLAWFGVVLPALLLNYFGQGALLLRQPGSGGQPVLPDGARLGAHPAGDPVDGRHCHRLAGRHLRRLLPVDAGGAARLQPAPQHRAHLRARAGADLPAGDQLGPDGLLHRAGGRLPHLQQPGGGLRHRRDHHHGHHHAAVLLPRLRPLALEAAVGRCSCAAASWLSTWRSSAPTSPRLPTAAGSRWWWPLRCSP